MHALSLDAPPAAAGEPASDLVRRASAGDRAALETLLGQVAPRMLAAARGVLGRDAAEVDDVVQEGLVAFMGSLASFRGQCPVEHYAGRIAVRIAMRMRRKVQRRAPKLQALAREPERSQPDTEDVLVRERRIEVLRELLDTLPEAQAEALALRCVLDHGLPEVAAVLSVPINTVRSRIRLAREALTRRIRRDPDLRELFEVDDA